MSNYNLLEKKISNFLKLNNTLHSFVKLFYQRLSFFLNKEKNFKSNINQNCVLVNLDIDNSFYGYYDHTPWSKDMKHFILHLQEKERLKLNLYTFSNNKISFKKTIISSKFYNFQQGLRPLWIDNNRIIFNQFLDEKLISTIYNIKDDSYLDLKFPVQEISPKNNLIISMDYLKLDIINKDYGYGIKDKSIKNKIDGIIGYNYLENKYIFKLGSEFIHKLSQNKDLPISETEINHINHSPYDKSFLFIYRNRQSKGFSELFKYNYLNEDIELLYSGKLMSHYCWINKNKIFTYLKHNNVNGFYEISTSNNVKINQEILVNVKDNYNDGHPSLSPNKKWIIYDSYPDKARKSRLYLIKNKKKAKKILIGTFYSPLNYYGYNRCDLHPRWSPNGELISFDSTHEGVRKTYLIKISNILKKYE